MLLITDTNATQLMKGLRAERFVVDATSPDIAAEGMSVVHYDVVVLHLRDNPTAIDVCRQLRASGHRAPVLVVLRATSPDLCVQALEAGADDCLGWPFVFLELVARIRTLGRRFAHEPVASMLQADDLQMDLRARTAFRGHRPLHLTPKESQLLEVFLGHPNEVLTRDQLLAAIWGLSYTGGGNIVDVYVSYLRSKIGAGTARIETVRGGGYRLRTSLGSQT